MRLFFILQMVATKKYIVILKDAMNMSPSTMSIKVDQHIELAKKEFTKDDKIEKTFMHGYLAELTDATKNKLQNLSSVESIEEDTTVSIQMIEQTDNSINSIFSQLNKSNYRNSLFNKSAQECIGIKCLEENVDLMANKHSYENETVNFVLQRNSPWKLSAISSYTMLPFLNTETEYEYIKNGGQNVNVYIIDTGIEVTHPEFSGRAEWGYNAIDGSPDKDEHGHGTHCAGTIGGKSTGVAKGARVIAVKVLDDKGNGLTSNMISGIEYVMNDHKRRKEEYYLNMNKKNKYFRFSDLENDYMQNAPKAVVNMSVGGSKSIALNIAVEYAIKHGDIHFSIAAGNEASNACNFSPGSAKHSLTIGAIDNNTIVAPFSNTGSCVDLYAPGVDIRSAWPGHQYKTISGTSMATPHASGIMAIYLGLVNFEPSKLKKRIIQDSLLVVKSNDFTNSYNTDKKNLYPMVSLEHLYYRLKMD